MTRSELYAYMEQPSRLTADTLAEMKQLYEAYSYCHTFVFLYLYNLYLVNDLRYPSELKRLAPYLADRRKLFLLVEEQNHPEQLQPTKSLDASDPFTLIESFLSEMESAGADLPQDIAGNIELSGMQEAYFGDSQLAEGNPVSASSLFEPLAQAVEPVPEREESKPWPTSKKNDPTEMGEELEESLFTETLAKIYIQQGHFDKALRIIRSISLNYPEKSRYFADQIRFLEKLIRIEQKHKQ